MGDNNNITSSDSDDSSYIAEWNHLSELKKPSKILTCLSELPEPTTEAMHFVNKLIKAGVVYRIFDNPLDTVKKIPPKFKHCFLGYFIFVDGVYQYMITSPSVQYYCVAEDGITVEVMKPTNFLNTNDFNKEYKTHDEVFQANDMSLIEPVGVPCINLLKIDTVNVERYINEITNHSAKAIESTEVCIKESSVFDEEFILEKSDESKDPIEIPNDQIEIPKDPLEIPTDPMNEIQVLMEKLNFLDPIEKTVEEE